MWHVHAHSLTSADGVAEDGFEDNPMLEAVRDIATVQGSPVVPVCAAIEAELATLDDEERLEYLSSMGLTEARLAIIPGGGVQP